jgi:hypothetical protein
LEEASQRDCNDFGSSAQRLVGVGSFDGDFADDGEVFEVVDDNLGEELTEGDEAGGDDEVDEEGSGLVAGLGTVLSGMSG